MTSRTVIGSGQPGELPDISTLSYEQARAELQEVVSILERGQMSLDESLHYWERGEALAHYCEQQLAGARQRIEQALNNTDPSNNEE